MGRFIFIIGGARSGKSSFSVDLAKRSGKKAAFIATCAPKDSEMKKRIAAHKKSRPKGWRIIEEEIEIKRALLRSKDKFDAIIIDCLGLWVCNMLLREASDKRIERDIEALCKVAAGAKADVIVVSNEVGLGLVPENVLGRRFRDALGRANQTMARYADTVYSMQVGIPTKIK